MMNQGSPFEVVKTIINFMSISEKLKFEKRHSWLSNGEQESVAEHCWQMSLLAILVNNHLDSPVDIAKTLKMIIIHDIVEAETGDIPCFEESERKKLEKENEARAIASIKRKLNGLAIGEEVYDLWYEFEDGKSQEARFAKALDNIEVQIQHNLADISTWESIEYNLARTKMDPHCKYDSFLTILCDAVKVDVEKKILTASTPI
jgi:putative hydrolase of HD superfamily